MGKPMKMMIVEDNSLEALGLSACVRELGHEVLKIAHDGQDAIDFARDNALDCILLDIDLGDRDGIETMSVILERQRVPFIFITGYSDAQTVERAARLCPYGYLVKPVDINDLRSALPVAMRMFDERNKLSQELEDSRRQLSDRKIIERAKGILMDSLDFSESAAMEFLQKKSQKTNRKVIDIAKSVIKMKETTGF